MRVLIRNCLFDSQIRNKPLLLASLEQSCFFSNFVRAFSMCQIIFFNIEFIECHSCSSFQSIIAIYS